MKDTDQKIQADDKDGRAKPAGRRWLRWLVVAGCVLLVGVLFLVALLPTLLSTGAGKRFIVGQANKQVVGRIEIDSLSLGWMSGQQVNGVVVYDANGTEVARIGRLDLPDASLLALARGRLNLGEIVIEKITGDIVAYEDGTTNLQRATSPRTPSKTPPSTGPVQWPQGLSLAVVVRDVDVSYRAEGVDQPIRLVMPEATLSAADPTHLELKLGADISQAQRKGSVSMDAKIDQLFGSDGVYQPAQATAHIDGQLQQLPIDLVDALAKQDGKLVTLLGAVLNGQIMADVTTAGGSAWVKADSEHLHINGKLAFDDKRIRRDGDTSIRLTVTPDAWVAQTSTESKPTSTLAEAVEVAIELRSLELPLGEQGLDLANARFDLGYSLSDTRLQIDGVGEVTLASTSGKLQTDSLGEKLTVVFSSVSGLNRKPGGVNVNVELGNLIGADQQFNVTGMTAKVNGRFTNAPVAAILDELLPGVTKGLATRTLGPAMDATLNLNTAPVPQGKGMAGAFDLDVLTEGGQAAFNTTLIGGFSFNKQAVHAELADGSYLKFTLPPDLIAAYQAAFASGEQTETADPNKQVTLAAPAKFRLDLIYLSADLRAKSEGGYELDPAKLRLNGKLSSPDIRMNQGGRYAGTLKSLLVDITNNGLGGDTRLVVNADLDTPTPAGEEPKPGLLMSDTTASRLAMVDGALSFKDASYKTNTQVRQASIDLIDAMFGLGGDLVASVGPRALLELNGSYTPSKEGTTGGLDLLIKSRFSSVDMKLLVEDEKWKLKNDAPMSFRVNNTFSQAVLKKVNPFLGKAVSAKLPINVTVRRDGFAVPLHEAKLNDIDADILLELGTLDLRGEGVLGRLLDQFGVDQRNLLNVGFSPVNIKLDDGHLSYTDFVMNVEDIRLGFSGNVDLYTHRLDMKISIPGSSLSRIKWLNGKITPDKVIVIPLTGTFDQPVIDFKLLTGEIAKEALKGELGGVAGEAIRDKIGGEAGEVVGGLLNDILKGTPQGPTQAPGPDTSQPESSTDTGETKTQDAEPSAQSEAELTPEEREARRERRRLRRERLEREAAEREAQQQQNTQ